MGWILESEGDLFGLIGFDEFSKSELIFSAYMISPFCKKSKNRKNAKMWKFMIKGRI